MLASRERVPPASYSAVSLCCHSHKRILLLTHIAVKAPTRVPARSTCARK